MSSPPYVERVWDIWGSYYSIPKAIFYLLKGDYKCASMDLPQKPRLAGIRCKIEWDYWMHVPLRITLYP